MNDNENARSSAATLKRAKAERATGKASHSTTNYSTAANMPQQIFDALPVGAENAISPAVLAARMGFNSLRSMRNAIEQERQAGALILSSFGGGYFRPSPGAKGRQEVEAFYHSQRAHAIAILRRLKAAGRALGVVDGQITLDGEDI